MQCEHVTEEFAGKGAAMGAMESLFGFNHRGQFFCPLQAFRGRTLRVVHQPLGEGLRKLCEWKLVIQYDALGGGSHARRAQFGMEDRLAALAGQLNVLDTEFLLRNHRSAEDGGAMAAARLGARPVLGPEGIDDLGSFVAIALPLFWRESERIEVGGHLLLDGYAILYLAEPTADMTTRTLRDIERLNDRLDLGLNLLKEGLYVFWIGAGELILDNEPGNRIEIDTRNLEAQA